jgi:hypothetical protein
MKARAAMTELRSITCGAQYMLRGCSKPRDNPRRMGTKSPESIGASIRAAAERAAEARKNADRLACEAWKARMLAFNGTAQPSPTLSEAINAEYGYLEVRCLAHL